MFGAVVAGGCTVTTSDDDDVNGGEGAEGAEGGTGGSSGGRGGTGGSTAGKAGSSGSTGKAGSAGSAGSSSSGTGGTDAGAGGEPGTGGTGGSGTSGAGGEGPSEDEIPECDPDEGDLDNTPYPTCEPINSDSACEVCIQESCCEESKECFSYAPGNVCGWGGPDASDTEAGEGEINCYQTCILEYIDENEGVCDVDGEDECIAQCTTDSCGQIGNQTQALHGCMWTNCADECFGVESCD
ncbi:MAG TPA: hypothetical protein VGK73_02930 [Polyangiaceae bacterium]